MMMTTSIERFKAGLEERRKHWDIGDIIDYALALADRKEFGCPAITSKKSEICMYFFDLVINQKLGGVPESLSEAFAESLIWDCRGPVPLSDVILDNLTLSGFTGMYYFTSEQAYCMKPSMAEHLLADPKYVSLDDAGKAFLQKVATDLSYNSPFWESFSPDLTPPYMRK